DVPSEPSKRPVQRSGEPRQVALFAGQRRAAPLITAVEKPDSGEIQFSCNGVNLSGIWRMGSLEPMARHLVHGRQQPGCKTGQPLDAFVTQRPSARAPFRGVANRAAMAHIDNRNACKGCVRHSTVFTAHKPVSGSGYLWRSSWASPEFGRTQPTG